jgi:hypothetical protein
VQAGTVEVVVVLAIVVVVVVVDVVLDVLVLEVAHPDGPQASQQLANTLGHPPRATQRAALRSTWHRDTPRRAMQQVTRPGLPHVDLAAHCTTLALHSALSCRAGTAWEATPRAHSTYARCVSACEQSHRRSTLSRTAATASRSPGASPQRSASAGCAKPTIKRIAPTLRR